MLRHRKPIRLGIFKRGNVEQQLQKLTKRHKYWLAQHRKCHIRQPIIQFIHIFKGLVLNLHRISDLLLYQCFRFSKIEMYTHTVVDRVRSQLFFGTSDYKTVDQVEMLKKFLQKKKLSQKSQKECDQYHLKLVAKKQADIAYPVQDFCGKIYSVLMLQSGDRALNIIQVSISHQEKANLLVQSLEKRLPLIRRSKQQRQNAIEMSSQLTLYSIPFLSQCYQREWTHMRKSILAFECLIKGLQARHKNETLHHS